MSSLKNCRCWVTSGLIGLVMMLAAIPVVADGNDSTKQEQTARKLAADKKAADKKVADKKVADIKKKADKKKADDKKKETAPQEVAVWKSRDREPVVKLTSESLDALLKASLGDAPVAEICGDQQFLRRASLDLIGRQPSPMELDAFLADSAPGKRQRAVDKLLANESFGRNWASYWSDTISYRTPTPQLTFLNYGPLRRWLAERLNNGAAWDEITWKLITATGKVEEHPEATFIGFHEASVERLAAETARIFLGQQLACAQCHDHKCESWEQDQFHQLAAFFVRTDTKVPWNDAGQILVSSKPSGEHKFPLKKETMQPAVFDGDPIAPGLSDVKRRQALADWLASDQNEFFAKAYTNRIWSQLIGRGFYEPVDHLSENVTPTLPEVHAALAEQFTSSGYDIKGLFRLLMNTEAYQRSLPAASKAHVLYSAVLPQKLRGDDVFDSLAAAIQLPNIKPKQAKQDGNFRFPPPPKSTRDLVKDVFNFDPSVDRRLVTRTMQQALWMMNNDQLQKQIDASLGSDTVLAKLLAGEPDDGVAVAQLFRLVFARAPTERELKISQTHIASTGVRGSAYEDLLWSWLNSTEFTTRR
ncbi:MAG: DUF1549 domain-containing protein [Pirellulaceae bacterium]|nr:DUF1549 domain-containing protein [Pirellulaceae bacterium]